MRKSETIDAYNKYAQVYDAEVTEFWDRFPRAFLNRFHDAVPGNRILNLGSGSGRDAVLLKALGIESVCVDASQSMIDSTKNLGFESHLADFTELNFPDGSFDGAWAYTSLIHIPKADAQKVIGILHRLIRPGGAFAIGVIEGTDEGMVERTTMPGAARYFKNYTAQELMETVEPMGFKLAFQNEYQPHNSVYINQLYARVEK